MGARFRQNDIRQTVIGSVTNEVGDVLGFQDATVGFLRTCNDVVGNRQGFNNLFIDTQNIHGGLLSGIRRNWQTHQPDRFFNDLPISALSHAMLDPSDVFPLGPLELNAYALKVLTKTSPSRPEVNVPAFLGELKDLPGMLKSWGDLFFDKNGKRSVAIVREARQRGDVTVANAILTYRWGLAPLISDLKKLLAIQKSIDAKFKELDNLRKGQVQKRRVSLDRGQVKTESGRFVAQSWQVLFDGYWKDNLTHTVWGSVQWYAPSWTSLAPLTDADLMSEATKTVLGFTQAGATQALWELLPWSWLADWFSNTGDVIASCGNSYNLDFRGLCVMQHLTGNRTFEHNNLHWDDYELSLQPIIVKREKKYRFANIFPIAFPSLRLPVLNYGKLSIIGSLSVLRFPEWFKFRLKGG